jgi:hypothetical protein
MIGLSLAGALAPSVAAQTRCTRDGDWLQCEDGRQYPIRPDPFRRLRPGSGRVEPRVLGDTKQEGGTTDATSLQTSDGQVCWIHGDHAHCQ